LRQQLVLLSPQHGQAPTALVAANLTRGTVREKVANRMRHVP